MIKRVSKTTIENEAKKKQKGGFLSMILGTLAASLIQNVLAGKEVIAMLWQRNSYSWSGFLRPPHPLTNFQIQKYYQNKPKVNGFYLRNDLPKLKDGAFAINLDDDISISTRWVAFYVNGDNIINFDSFGVEYIPKETKKFIENQNITSTIFIIQTNESVMCGYFCIEFINFMIKGKSLLHYTNLFSPSEYEKNDEMILNYFQKLKSKNFFYE